MTCINGVVIGRISLEHKGSYTVRCLATGLTAAVKLHASTMLTSRAKMHEVQPPLQGLRSLFCTCMSAS